MAQLALEEARTRVLARPRNLEFLLRRRTAFLRKHLRKDDRVLEVGAGLGFVELYLDGVRLTATDVHQGPWLHTAADAMQLPFRAQAFDAVVCLNVLHHLSHPREGIREMIRVLRPGGLLLVTEPHASVVMRMALRFTGHEYVDPRVDPFGSASCQTAGDPRVNGNNAVGDLLFTNRDRFQRAFPQLRVEAYRLVECLAFLNSGGVGFEAPCIPLPQIALEWTGALDDWLVRFPALFPLCHEVVLRKAVA